MAATTRPMEVEEESDKKDKKVSSFFKNLFSTKMGAEQGGIEGPLSSNNSATTIPAKSFSKPNGLQSTNSGQQADVAASKMAGLALQPSGPSASSPRPPASPKPTMPSAHRSGSPARHPSVTAPAAAPAAAAPAPVKPPPPDTILLAVAPVLPPNMARENWCMKDYAIVEKMYTGYASTVYKAWCKASGETVCLKVYNMANLCELNRYQIYREVKLHSNLQHENIITLFAAFKQGDQVVLVQEFADSGDLFMLLHRYGGKLPEKTAVELVLHPFLCVLKYLHTNCVVHRDIKPENVLFTRTMQLKLCDFGLAIDLREERAVTRAGTLEYMAPEVLNCPFKNKPQENKDQQSLHYTLTVDTWAVGVLTYELLVGFPPFNDKQRAAIEHKIRVDTPRFPSSMTELGRNFVMKALQKDALERPTIQELLTHPWVRGHRRNASQRNLALGGTSRPQVEVEDDGEEGGDTFKIPATTTSTEQRTVGGDLLQAMPSYASFSTGANRPKFLQAQVPAGQQIKVKKAGEGSAGAAVAQNMGMGMSFSTAQNPKLQALRGLAGY